MTVLPECRALRHTPPKRVPVRASTEAIAGPVALVLTLAAAVALAVPRAATAQVDPPTLRFAHPALLTSAVFEAPAPPPPPAPASPTIAAPQAPGPALDGIGQQYQAASRLWRPRLIPIAQRLFVLLASIEFVVSGAVWALRRDSLDDIAAKFLLKFTLVAFLLALITSYTFWFPPLINGFATAGERAIGGLTVSPSSVIDIGQETAFRVLAALDLAAMLRDPAMAVFAALAALIILLAYIAIAAQLILVLVESYVVLGGGVLFLGFAAFRGTAGFAENLVAYTFGVGIKVFLLYLIVGLGTEIARGWIPLIDASTLFGPASPFFQVIGGSVVFAVLAIRIPNATAARLSGSTSLGLAAALRALG